jgi:hypothetical protein
MQRPVARSRTKKQMNECAPNVLALHATDIALSAAKTKAARLYLCRMIRIAIITPAAYDAIADTLPKGSVAVDPGVERQGRTPGLA